MTDEYERHEAAPLEAELERHRQALHSAAAAFDARKDNVVVSAALLQERAARLRHVWLMTGLDVPGLQAVKGHAKALQAEVDDLEKSHAGYAATLEQQANRIQRATETVHALRMAEDPGERAKLARKAREQVSRLARFQD